MLFPPTPLQLLSNITPTSHPLNDLLLNPQTVTMMKKKKHVRDLREDAEEDAEETKRPVCLDSVVSCSDAFASLDLNYGALTSRPDVWGGGAPVYAARGVPEACSCEAVRGGAGHSGY